MNRQRFLSGTSFWRVTTSQSSLLGKLHTTVKQRMVTLLLYGNGCSHQIWSLYSHTFPQSANIFHCRMTWLLTEIIETPAAFVGEDTESQLHTCCFCLRKLNSSSVPTAEVIMNLTLLQCACFCLKYFPSYL